ncbi:MAG: translation elongation factor-like protein [Deltaproteobacteria bacterium]|nr:translation elongation factor-like protein [Deltaproteobacteria bacterium]
MQEDRIGTISHYYSHLGVAAISLDGELRVGDMIHIKGHTSDFVQNVDSIEVAHHQVETAGKGDKIGIRVKEHTRVHDTVYRVTGERDAA